MSQASALSAALEQLSSTFSGRLLAPGSASYDEARRVHNGLIDRRPSVIAQCRGTVDVVEALGLARGQGLEVSIRGGGHNVAGRAVVDGGLMIDLSPMRAVYVDAAARTARAQGGVTWREFNRETQLHGLATTGGVIGTTGIAGLTLGGGIGYLMGQYGLAVDNLLSVELVTADGSVLTASKDEHADLFWALRGGGGNFGVATSLEYRLHEVGPTVSGGLIAYPLSAGRDVMRFFREVTQSLPDEMSLFGGFVHAPDGSGAKLAAIVACHAGSLEDGAEAMRPLKEFGTPAMDLLGPITYCDMNGILDAGYPKGALNYWKSSFLAELTDEAIDTMVASFEECPVSMSALLLEHLHGEATRVSVEDTAFAQRHEGYNCGVFAEWMDHSDTDACMAWTRETYQRLLPHMATGRYVNYLGDDEAAGAVAAAYGPNFARLQELKKRYDPDNIFHVNQNISPAA